MLRLLALLALAPGILSGKKGTPDSDDWGYREHNGPETWPQLCQIGLAQVCLRGRGEMINQETVPFRVRSTSG